MAILDELVSQIDNPDLRARIAAEVEKLAKQKKFGLVFEEHLPECTPLYEIPVKAGATVALKAGQVNDVYAVLKIENGVASCLRKADKKQHEIAVEDLVTVAEFGDPIYPQLIPMDTVENAPDSDLWHKKNAGQRNYRGYGWSGPLNRWCTKELKTIPREKFLRQLQEHYDIIEYVGLAADEGYRFERENNQKPNCRHPLVDWGMTEADCLQYCYDRGYTWGGLYKQFSRVSCWCCPL